MSTPPVGRARPVGAPAVRTSRHRRTLAAAAALAGLAGLTLLGACAAADDVSSAGSDTSADVPMAAEGAPEAAAERSGQSGLPRDSGELEESALADAASAYDAVAGGGGTALATGPTGRGGTAPATQAVPGDRRSLIRTGNVALRADDVPTARFDVGKVLDAHGGEIAEESTQADDDGDVERVRLVARVPVAEFDATMADFTGVADLIDVSTQTQDVSTEVIDNQVRVELQRRSIDRISILLDSAADLRDIVTIERELAQREAELGSLEKRQAFLADQTSMATITLSIEPPKEEPEPPALEEEDGDGFLAGLSGGWDALQDVTTGLLTVGGAVLPFAVVLLVLAVPGRLLARRFLPRTPASATAGAPPATA